MWNVCLNMIYLVPKVWALAVGKSIKLAQSKKIVWVSNVKDGAEEVSWMNRRWHFHEKILAYFVKSCCYPAWGMIISLTRTKLKLKKTVLSKICFHNSFWMETILRNMKVCMTTLLPHIFLVFTGTSFILKTIKYLHKKFRSCLQLSKRWQKFQNSYFQSQFSMSKMVRIFQTFFHF